MQDISLTRGDINSRARDIEDTWNTDSFNMEEESWNIAVLELALEGLGIDPQKLYSKFPSIWNGQGCCSHDSHESYCECCTGECQKCSYNYGAMNKEVSILN